MPKNAMRPVHPGEVLREEFLVPLCLSAHALAQELRVPATRINDFVNERRAITADTALRLSRYFGTTAAFWLNPQSAFDLRTAEGEPKGQIERECCRGRCNRVRARADPTKDSRMDTRHVDQFLRRARNEAPHGRQAVHAARAAQTNEPDVCAIREAARISQSQFAELMGLTLRQLRKRKQRRTRRTGPAHPCSLR